jgi:hypothetical protein
MSGDNIGGSPVLTRAHALARRGAEPATWTPPLRALRRAHGFGLREVAHWADVDPAHLSRVERGQGDLSVRTLLRLVEVLGPPELGRLLRPYVRPAERAI